MADVHGRGSLGFALVRRTDVATGIVTATTLRQDYPHVGQPARVRVTSRTGTVLSDTQNTFALQTLTHPSGARTTFAFARQSVVTRDDLDGSELGTETAIFEYGDGWGNRARHSVSTAAAGKTFSADTVIVYSNDSTKWLLGLPTSIKVTKTDPVNGSVTRTTGRAYSSSTGLLDSETIEPGTAQYELTTANDRTGNPFGLVNKQKQTWRDPYTQTTRTRTLTDTTYDPKGRFPTTVKNALGHAERRTYAAATGAQTSVTGPNQLTTTWTVDGFGRIQKELRPDGTETRYWRKRCESDCVEDATTATIAESYLGSARTAVPLITYADNAGRLLRTLTWGFDGRKIVVDKHYDSQGRLSQDDFPRYELGAAILDSGFAYDDLGRVVSSTELDEAGAQKTTTTTYQGLVRVHKNAKQQQRTETRNALGALVQVKDAKNGLTSFSCDGFGNLVQTTDPANNKSTVSYDRLGWRTALDDPNLGLIEYGVDPLGQVWSQVSPNQRAAVPAQKTRFEFDLLGRMTGRYEPDLESHWIFDTAAKGIGQLAEAYTGKPTAKDYRRTHSYDSLGRPSVTTQMLTDASYTDRTDYDAWGRPYKETYQRGTDPAKAYEWTYNAWGQHSALKRGSTALWQVTAQDAANRPTTIQLGNGLTQSRSYSPHSARLESATLKQANNNARLQESYHYDALGNVDRRTQLWDAGGFDESFTYDELNRLKTSQVVGQPTQSFGYDAIGNLTSKTGLGAYQYDTVTTWVLIPLDDLQMPVPITKPAPAGQSRPGAVARVGNSLYDYDANGNLTSGGGRRIDWLSFDMPAKISKGSQSSAFAYGPEHQRAKQVRSDGTTIVYAGAQEVQSNAGGLTVKTYWPGGVGVEIDRPGAGAAELNWVHLDRLGSPIAITNASGAIKEKLSYDAWGKRRTSDGAATPDTLDGQTDNKGFTGHEMLDQLELVHMNGRVYDPLLGRFVSADPLVNDPTNGQSYNRYSYVLNNPTNLTDPTGFKEQKQEAEKCDARCQADRKAALKQIADKLNSGITLVAEDENGELVVIKSSDAGYQTWTASGRVEAARGEVAGTGLRIGGAVRSFFDGGFGDKAAAADANGEDGWAAAYVAAGTAYGVANGLTLGEAGGISKLLTGGLTKLESLLAAQEAGSIRGVNAIGGKMNCVNCTVATDATLAGRPASALGGGPLRIDVLEKAFGRRFGAPGPISSVSEAMSAAGPGARGIVFGSRGSGEVGHVFNVVNQKGVVRFLDGQTGRAASLEGYESFQLLRTN